MSLVKKHLSKTFIIEAVLLLLVMNVFAQNNLSGDTLILKNQGKFWLNEELVFGTGTMPDQSYSYIYEAPNPLQKLINNHKRKLLLPRYKGYKSKVIKFEKEIGHNKKEYDYTILVLETADGTKYWCDVANALTNHEILLKGSEKSITESNSNNSSQKPSVNKHPKTKTTNPVSVF